MGPILWHDHDTREEIKHRINMGNACYYSVEKLLSSSLLSKNLKVRIYKTVILPVVLYGCETWTLTLTEEQRLRVFENKVLRKIFGAKRDEVTGEWRKLHSTELHAFYSSPGIIRNIKSRRLRWTGHVARMGESRNAYRVLVGRPEGKRPLGRHWLFNDALSTTRLLSVDEIGDSEIRPRIRHRLPGIHLTVGENNGKNPTRNVINLVDKFRATECTERKKSVIWPTKMTEDAVEDARERMQRGPNKSVKKLAVEIGEHPLVAKRFLQGTFTTMFAELREDDTKFFNYFRMSIKSFDELACKISDLIKSEDTVMKLAIPPLEMRTLNRDDTARVHVAGFGKENAAPEEHCAVYGLRRAKTAQPLAFTEGRAEAGDNASEMSPGSSTESYPAFARIGLRENPGKNLNQVTCPDRDSNLGHLVSQPDALTVTPQPMKGQDRPAGCWPHAEADIDDHPTRLVSTMIPSAVVAGLLPKCITMLSGHRSHTLAEIS
ncbi:hypothetical protein ANN_05922 [Periplaneta americana]|uniref:Uncharacterized protein n=1 Tax=Periplaneta americana TaxID=6978 RepID=A0ABQ8TC53_PERAM|nr:hypothetical protein ANN_05922 [Periplaneta americana]